MPVWFKWKDSVLPSLFLWEPMHNQKNLVLFLHGQLCFIICVRSLIVLVEMMTNLGSCHHFGQPS